jgi:SAM-dependent methyltransferase
MLLGPPGGGHKAQKVSRDGELFECHIELFDAEADNFPFEDGFFTTVLCCELIEHLREDPMHLMAEVNRILKPGGHVVITTPNITSLQAVSAILQGFHPGLFHSYVRPRANGETEARHNREYTPGEIQKLLEVAGFEITLLETGPFREQPRPEYAWVRYPMERYQFDSMLRGGGNLRGGTNGWSGGRYSDVVLRKRIAGGAQNTEKTRTFLFFCALCASARNS